MCGIAGFLFLSESTEASPLDSVRRMTARMHTRGPDAEAVWAGEGVVLGHRRLAILDLDARANQPMVSSDGRYTITFNGEIYNFRELRRALEVGGIALRTTSDTEVLLELFAREGERMLPRLRGMFAFGIWDAHTRELFIARDPYGIKPLYYTRTKDGLLFASQVKALLASDLVSTKREPAGLVGFYLWGSVPEPWTLYRDIFALPAGHWLKVRADVPDTLQCWYDIRTHWQDKQCEMPPDELNEWVRQAVVDSVRAHLVSDVPVSVLLSGGIDSSVLAALASEMGARIEGITIGFEEFIGHHQDEVPVAAEIAAHYGLTHHVRRVSHAEFDEDIPRILQAMDQPSIDGVNTWFASKAVAERGYKVVLSGLGGDELLCGYPSFQQVPKAAALGRAFAAIPGARALLRAPCAYFATKRSQPKLGGVPIFMGCLEGIYFLRRCLFLPEELPALIGVDMTRAGLDRLGGFPPGMTKARAIGDVSAVGLLESTLYLRNQLLRDSDWASMAHSLELRTPLVDVRLLAKLAPYVPAFTGGVGKAMLAQSPYQPLPESIINRPKTGFELPMDKWLTQATDHSAWADLRQLSASRSPWARRWATRVLGAAE